MNLDAILEGFVEHLRSQQFISDTKAQVFRFDSAAVFTQAEDAAREEPGFSYVVGFEGAGTRYPYQNPIPMTANRLFIVCLHGGLSIAKLRPLQAAELLTLLNATTFLADGRQIQVWLPQNIADLTATVPCMEYTLNFELIAS